MRRSLLLMPLRALAGTVAQTRTLAAQAPALPCGAVASGTVAESRAAPEPFALSRFQRASSRPLRFGLHGADRGPRREPLPESRPSASVPSPAIQPGPGASP